MQQNVNTTLLESKLKRLKISFSKKNDKIIIAQSNTDYTILLGLIFLPIIAGIAILGFLFPIDSVIRESHSRKVIVASILFISFGITNIIRMRSKSKANKLTKVLGHKEIILNTKEASKRFDTNNIKHFDYTIKKLDEQTYSGNLFLVDTQQNKHLILGFDAETEQYLIDDLKWFSNYFSAHVQLNTQK
ncbi:hypothetical protein U8527_12905 [Kordia algicida OT-1]|uniref:Uncharacterized protein n=1 Tax=Kordia algicida OT-1 TaxID=391587 RepID=A9E4M2_9FLAO|nr:hypothetical protein [Kordia algicida]EDP95108.1 hypothetical protein KAOT1_06482 [Kordia algicida OT-1]